MMPWMDALILALVAVFTGFGVYLGFVHTLANIVGVFFGVIVGTRLASPAADRFGWMFGGGGFGKVVVFILLFFLSSRLFSFLFWILSKFLGALAWIPFASTLNRVLGGIVGFIEGLLVVGFALFVIMALLPPDMVKKALEPSWFAPGLLLIAQIFQVLVPAALQIKK